MRSAKRTLEVDDFRIVRQPPLSPAVRARTAERDRLTDAFLAAAPPPGEGVLSGSFVYAHPPDYRGRPTLGWGATAWRALFREFRELGLDTAILQASAWVDFAEVYYPSRVLAGYRQWDVVGPLLDAAEAEGMTVFLGGAGILFSDEELGVAAGDVRRAAAAAAREVACFRELADRYGGRFHGYYLGTETGFDPGRAEHHRACFHTYFERVTHGVRDLAPRLPILSSPYTVCAAGQEAEAADYLTALHAGCPIDILAPQDSIGCFNNLPFLERGLGVWKAVCRNLGVAFWTNCESFRVVSYDGPALTIEAADYRRFAVQLATAARAGAAKLVTWEAMHFLNPAGDDRARRLRSDYLACRASALRRI